MIVTSKIAEADVEATFASNTPFLLGEPSGTEPTKVSFPLVVHPYSAFSRPQGRLAEGGQGACPPLILIAPRELQNEECGF